MSKNQEMDLAARAVLIGSTARVQTATEVYAACYFQPAHITQMLLLYSSANDP